MSDEHEYKSTTYDLTQEEQAAQDRAAEQLSQFWETPSPQHELDSVISRGTLALAAQKTTR